MSKDKKPAKVTVYACHSPGLVAVGVFRSDNMALLDPFESVDTKDRWEKVRQVVAWCDANSYEVDGVEWCEARKVYLDA